MNAFWTALAVILLCTFASADIRGDCRVYVAENGQSLVLLALYGEGVTEIPLPIDVPYPTLEGAVYVQSKNGIDVSMMGDNAVLAYKSSLLTSKIGEMWRFSFQTPMLNRTGVTVSLPAAIEIKELQPQGNISTRGNTTDIRWDLEENSTISISYTFPKDSIQPFATTTTLAVTRQIGLYAAAAALMVFLVLALIMGVYFVMTVRSRKRLHKKLMGTLSGNEYTVVDTLLKNGGGMKRNELERVSEMAKSSLAAVVNNLERKGIITVDRRYNTHYIEVTKSFKEP